MSGAGADDGDAECNIDRGIESQQLDGNMALVVIHGHHAIEFAADGAAHQCVDRQRTGNVDRVLHAGGHCGGDDARFFIAEQSVFATMWIQRTDTDRPSRTADPCEKIMQQPDLFGDTFGCEPLRDARDGIVQRDMGDAEAMANAGLCVGGIWHDRLPQVSQSRFGQMQHHRESVNTALLSEDFCVAGKIVAGGMQRGFVQWSRAHGINDFVHRHVGRSRQVLIRGCTGGGADLAARRRCDVDVRRIGANDPVGRGTAAEQRVEL